MKKQLIKHIKGGEAFYPIDKMLGEIPYSKVGIRPSGLPYSFYELFYHIVFAQKDIIDFCIAGDYTKVDWPDGYWPKEQSPSNETEWQKLKNDYFKDQETFLVYVENEDTDLSQVVRHGDSQTVLREILLIIEHTAYHTGQMLIVLRLLDLHEN